MSKSSSKAKSKGEEIAENSRAPHAAEREQAILALLHKHRFVTFRNLEREVDASPATLRRDLERLASEGHITRVHGAVKLADVPAGTATSPLLDLKGVPFHENIGRHTTEKQAIGRAAAALLRPGEAVIIDGGSTTLQMCPHLSGMHLQVFTNSLHIVSALLSLPDVRVQVPGGTVFREQNIILGASGDDLMPNLHAPQLFMGAAAVGTQGIMQADLVLVAAERRLIERADELILLIDSSKFRGPAGNLVCGLEEVDIVVTDRAIERADRRMLEAADVRVIVAE
jgi:DeoR family ulaG and ulaABCDEF operon transcriptional repressor